MKTLSFTKEATGWYIDLPEWEGDKGELAMVAGADDLLDALDWSKKGNVILNVSLEPTEKSHTLYLKEFTPQVGGALYTVAGEESFPKEIWLCAVTEFVFGNMPRTIYFNKQ